jgi:hypothetical protein
MSGTNSKTAANRIRCHRQDAEHWSGWTGEQFAECFAKRIETRRDESPATSRESNEVPY